RRVVDLVHIGEIVVCANAMQGHHATHGGAEALVIILLQGTRLVARNVQPRTDELADPGVDLLPQVDVMRIQRVVQGGHPAVDVGEGPFCCHRGNAKRSVLPPPLMSTAAKPVAAKPRLPQSPCSLVSNLLSRVQSWVVPPQFSGLSLSLIARLSLSTASAKL